MKLPPYPKYKPSGVEWLGDVPEHWQLSRVGALFRFYSGGTPDTEVEDFWGGDIPWVSAKDMKVLRIADSADHISERAVAESATSLMPEGAVLLVARSGILRHTLPVAVAQRPVAINQDIKGLVPINGRADPVFFAYLIQGNQPALLTLWRQQGATVESLNVDRVKTTAVFLAPLAEQVFIADFLDRKTANISVLIARKRALIERLTEKRAALISRTVTRGLPPNAARDAGFEPRPQLKPSGTDWLGDVPRHWEITRVSRQFRNLDHRRIPVASEVRSDLDKVYPYYGASGIIDFVDRYLFDERLILVAEDGANLLTRASPLAFIASGKYWVNNHAHILKPMSGDIEYWVAVLQTHDFTPLITGAAQPKLTSERLGSVALPKPPEAEQRAIASFLRRETAIIDQMITNVETVIERLQEYRSALITSAVTGKIDVRSAASEEVRVMRSTA